MLQVSRTRHALRLNSSVDPVLLVHSRKLLPITAHNLNPEQDVQ